MKGKFLVLIALGLIVFISCTPTTKTPEPQISNEKAIIIAATNVPYSVIKQSGITTRFDGNNWIIYFMIPVNLTVNKDELNWPEGSATKFENLGMLPAGTFSLLMFTINDNTGDILSRYASDASHPLGGPGDFYTPPPPATALSPWFIVVAAIVGGLIGGITVFFIMRRKMKPR